jgi:uncharacterized protein (DUF433 family)
MNPTVIPEPLPLAGGQDGGWRVGGTRVTLDTVIAAFNQGATAEEIVQQYPALALADVYAVIGYYLRHKPEVDAYLANREADAAAVREKVERELDVHNLRERLLARRSRTLAPASRS